VVMCWCALVLGLVFIRFVSFRVVNAVPGSFFTVLCCGGGDQRCFESWSTTLALRYSLLPACPSLSFIVSRLKELLKLEYSSQLALLALLFPVLFWRLCDYH